MPVISFDIGELTKGQKEILAKEFTNPLQESQDFQ